MRWNHQIRQAHRWLSLAFTVAVIANITAMIVGSPATWIGFAALVPLIPLLITGAYLFGLPYLGRGPRAAVDRPSG